MKILTIFLSLAKILGIILLVVLTIFLLILALILFCNIKFSLISNNRDNTYYKIKISYLFGIVNYTLDSEHNKNILKIFGFNINKEKKSSSNKKLNKDKTEKNISYIDSEQDGLEKTYNIEDEDTQDLGKDLKTEIEKDEKNINKKAKKEKTNKKKKSENTKQNKKQKWIDIKNKIKCFIEYKDKKYVFDSFLELIKRLIKSIKFKKIFINIEYGLEDPFKTGNICAIISLIMPLIAKKDIKIVPNFEESMFLADLNLKFRVTIFRILWPILIFISKKTIRKIIFRKGE